MVNISYIIIIKVKKLYKLIKCLLYYNFFLNKSFNKYKQLIKILMKKYNM